MTQRTDLKDPADDAPFTADFTNDLALFGPDEEIVTVTSVDVTVTRGADPTPNAIKSGLPQIAANEAGADNRVVIQLITGGLDQCDYHIKVTVKTTNDYDRVIAGIVPVRSK